MTKKVPSPCIGVCKFKDAGHCIACAQTKRQKKMFKKLKSRKKRLKHLSVLLEQQDTLGGRPKWARIYRRLCARKGIECPLETIARKGL